MSSDDVVHRCYRDPTLVAQVRERFGDTVVSSDGSVDRVALGALVFDDAAARGALERLIHPRIQAAREAWIAEQRAADPSPPLLVCEVPLLFEVGLADRFDAVLVVTASDDVRRARVAARGQDFALRAAQQMAESEKVRLADHAYVNDGSLQALESWVQERFREYSGS